MFFQKYVFFLFVSTNIFYLFLPYLLTLPRVHHVISFPVHIYVISKILWYSSMKSAAYNLHYFLPSFWDKASPSPLFLPGREDKKSLIARSCFLKEEEKQVWWRIWCKKPSHFSKNEKSNLDLTFLERVVLLKKREKQAGLFDFLRT